MVAVARSAMTIPRLSVSGLRRSWRSRWMREVIRQHEEEVRCHRRLADDLQRDAAQHLARAAEHAAAAAAARDSLNGYVDAPAPAGRPASLAYQRRGRDSNPR